jgi:predicted hotdog family 3-hydroxylacyl-ACP dehydratase
MSSAGGERRVKVHAMGSSAPSAELAELIPHRGPMMLLDSVVAHGERDITCLATIRADHPFLEEGEVDVLVCVELVAQAVAAYAGYRDRLSGRRPELGFIVSCREASFEVPAFALGDALTVEARHVWGEAQVGSFKGTVQRNGAIVAAVELGVYRGPLAVTEP